MSEAVAKTRMRQGERKLSCMEVCKMDTYCGNKYCSNHPDFYKHRSEQKRKGK